MKSLSGRLVATAVALVALVGLLVSATTAVAMQRYLTDRLDIQLEQSLRREAGPLFDSRLCPLDAAATPPDDARGPRGLAPGQSSGTLTVRPGCAFVITDTGGIQELDEAALDQLTGVEPGAAARSVSLPGLGSYRVQATSTVVTGLPQAGVDAALRNLMLVEGALLLMGVLLAGAAGTVLVRRQLRPLHDVASVAHEVTSQELVRGEPTIRTRAPEDLTDPATEVGQVGGALNALLDHVDTALAARHASEQQVRQFVADASHELRTPLATIHGYAELARRTPGDIDRLTSSLAKVETEAGRMSALVEDLLLLARLDAGRPLEREPVDLTHVLLEAVTDARVLGPAHHWRLTLPDEPIEITGDAGRLRQVITNLLNNARSHTPPGTTVTVASRATRDAATVSVHDDGPGLPAHLRETAFERFSRGDSSRTRSSGGAGLGLSLVAAICQAHRGSAQVHSRPGDTTFTLTLPR